MKYYLIKVEDNNPTNGVYGNEQTGFHIVEKEISRVELTKEEVELLINTYDSESFDTDYEKNFIKKLRKVLENE